MYNEKDADDFLQWMIEKGKAKRELTDIFINDNGEIKIEKKMAWVVKNTAEDWEDFCNDTGREYEFVKLLANKLSFE